MNEPQENNTGKGPDAEPAAPPASESVVDNPEKSKISLRSEGGQTGGGADFLAVAGGPAGGIPRRRGRWNYPFALVVIAVLAAAITLWVTCARHRVEVTPAPPLVIPEPALPAAVRADEAALVFVGDVMLARGVARSVAEHRGDYAFLFEKMAPFLNEGDVAFCNLVCALSDGGKALKKNHTYRAAPEAAAVLADGGFDVASLANSHILDYGVEAAKDTAKHLAAADIKNLGLVEDDRPQTPAIVEANGIRIGYLAYADPRPKYAYPKAFRALTVRPARGDIETIGHDIAQLKPEADIIVVSMHWGVEFALEPNADQQKLGRAIIDAGAQIVAGHHPHVQQEPEAYHGGLILYSLGSFIADLHTRPGSLASRLYRVVATKSGLVRAEYLPLRILHPECQPVPDSAAFVSVPLRRPAPE